MKRRRPRPRFPVVPVFQVARDRGWHPTPVDLHSEIVDRALREVSPSQSMEEACRKEIAAAIEMEPIKSYNLTNDAVVTWHAFPDRNERRALKNLVFLLDRLEKVIDSLPPHWQQVLFKKPAKIRGTRVVGDKTEINEAGTGLCWPAAAERVEIFCRMRSQRSIAPISWPDPQKARRVPMCGNAMLRIVHMIY